jgi:hypothetical protein
MRSWATGRASYGTAQPHKIGPQAPPLWWGARYRSAASCSLSLLACVLGAVSQAVAPWDRLAERTVPGSAGGRMGG